MTRTRRVDGFHLGIGRKKKKVKRIINICAHTFIIITIHVLKEKDRLILYKKRHKVLSPLDINIFYKYDMNYYYYKI